MMQRDYAVSGSLVYASLKNGTANFYCIPKYRVSAAKTIGDSYAAVPFKTACSPSITITKTILKEILIYPLTPPMFISNQCWL